MSNCRIVGCLHFNLDFKNVLQSACMLYASCSLILNEIIQIFLYVDIRILYICEDSIFSTTRFRKF